MDSGICVLNFSITVTGSNKLEFLSVDDELADWPSHHSQVQLHEDENNGQKCSNPNEWRIANHVKLLFSVSAEIGCNREAGVEEQDHTRSILAHKLPPQK